MPWANTEQDEGGNIGGTTEILKKVDEGRDLTVMVVSGRVTARQIIEALVDYYDGAFTQNLIWDYTAADLTAVANDDLRRISSVATGYAHLRKEGRTAIVMPEILGFGLGRMYEILSEIDDNPIQYRIFKSSEEALRWLDS